MMLLRMASEVAAARALCYACAHAIDMSRIAPPNERAAWADRAGLLTPVAKAWSTDAAVEVASLGIQAIDLVTRKLLLADGAAVTAVTAEIAAIVDALRMSRRVELQALNEPIAKAAEDLAAATAFMREALQGGRKGEALLGATAYLRILAMTFSAALLAKGALAATGDPTGARGFAKATFFAHTVLPEVSSLRVAVEKAGVAVGDGAAAVLGGV